jgi:hypothetical protein
MRRSPRETAHDRLADTTKEVLGIEEIQIAYSS